MHRSDLVSPTNFERQPITDVRRGFWVLASRGQSVPVGFLSSEPAVTAVGFCLFQVFGALLQRCPRGLEDRVGRQPPEIRFRLLSARELGSLARFRRCV